MVDIRPFRGLRYNTRHVDPHAVLAPPYDVVGTEAENELLARSPYNAAHVELAPGKSADRFGTRSKEIKGIRTSNPEFAIKTRFLGENRFGDPPPINGARRHGLALRVGLLGQRGPHLGCSAPSDETLETVLQRQFFGQQSISIRLLS